MASKADIAREKQWQAEEDAHTLARAQEITSKKGRLNAAQVAARRLAREETARATAMKNVAGGVKLYRKMGTGKKKMGGK